MTIFQTNILFKTNTCPLRAGGPGQLLCCPPNPALGSEPFLKLAPLS